MSLKDVMNRLKEGEPAPAEFSLGSALWAHYAAMNESEDESREDGNHPSQLYRFCPRKEILKHFFPKQNAEDFSPEVQTAFDWGTAWHWLLQNLRLGPMGHLWGDWRCEKCGFISKGRFMPPPHTDCRHGSEKLWLEMVEEDVQAGKRARRGGYWRYLEPRIKSGPPWNIVGQCDGILYPVPWKMEGDPFMLEIKTSNDNSFQRLFKPDPGYVFQISLYLHFLNLKRCLLTYWTKGTAAKPKEFWVTEDATAFEETKSRLTLFERAWPEKRLCTGICKDESADQGKWCGWRSECFSKTIEEEVEKERVKRAG